MRVIVDDMLALLANLGVLDVPDAIELPLLTVYSFQLRTAGAIGVPRTTEGLLQRTVRMHLPPGANPLELLAAQSNAVHVLNPTNHAAAVASGKARWGSFVPAEVVAAAQRESAEVRLSGGNAAGKLRDALVEAEVPFATWHVEPVGSRYSVVERSW